MATREVKGCQDNSGLVIYHKTAVLSHRRRLPTPTCRGYCQDDFVSATPPPYTDEHCYKF
ncbi:hypothetical protein J6590_092846 [Homalodisca vitripennis]|nr:hypothetical protein J6590_092846 [Homalodisca vitripennis]